MLKFCFEPSGITLKESRQMAYVLSVGVPPFVPVSINHRACVYLMTRSPSICVESTTTEGRYPATYALAALAMSAFWRLESLLLYPCRTSKTTPFFGAFSLLGSTTTLRRPSSIHRLTRFRLAASTMSAKSMRPSRERLRVPPVVLGTAYVQFACVSVSPSVFCSTLLKTHCP